MKKLCLPLSLMGVEGFGRGVRAKVEVRRVREAGENWTRVSYTGLTRVGKPRQKNRRTGVGSVLCDPYLVQVFGLVEAVS